MAAFHSNFIIVLKRAVTVHIFSSNESVFVDFEFGRCFMLCLFRCKANKSVDNCLDLKYNFIRAKVRISFIRAKVRIKVNKNGRIRKKKHAMSQSQRYSTACRDPQSIILNRGSMFAFQWREFSPPLSSAHRLLPYTKER